MSQVRYAARLLERGRGAFIRAGALIRTDTVIILWAANMGFALT